MLARTLQFNESWESSGAGECESDWFPVGIFMKLPSRTLAVVSLQAGNYSPTNVKSLYAHKPANGTIKKWKS
jgi:hypothetical protein